MDKYQNIYNIVKQIPSGKVATYGQIAKLSNTRSPRLVGLALHRNPCEEKIPCHRVVNARGEIAANFAFGGASRQIEKLSAEGVIIKSNNKVNLKEYQWI